MTCRLSDGWWVCYLGTWYGPFSTEQEADTELVTRRSETWNSRYKKEKV